jgi:hypothetical protein
VWVSNDDHLEVIRLFKIEHIYSTNGDEPRKMIARVPRDDVASKAEVSSFVKPQKLKNFLSRCKVMGL